MELHKLNPEDIKAFIVAGKAIVTVESTSTGARYTYRIKQKKDDDIWFVQLLKGPDNTADYVYIGFFRDDFLFRTSAKSQLHTDSLPCVAIKYVLGQTSIGAPVKCNVYHSCHCGRCGRLLTTPESIISGLGPECRRHAS